MMVEFVWTLSCSDLWADIFRIINIYLCQNLFLHKMVNLKM